MEFTGNYPTAMTPVFRLALIALAVVVSAAGSSAQTSKAPEKGNLARAASPNEVRALVVPRREAKLSSRITARIISIGPEPGIAFK